MSNPDDIASIKSQVAEGMRDIRETPAEDVVTTWEAVSFEAAREQIAALAATLATLHTVQIENAINADVRVHESAEYALELFEAVAGSSSSRAAEDMIGQTDWLKSDTYKQMARGFSIRDQIGGMRDTLDTFAAQLAELAGQQKSEVSEAKDIVARRTSALNAAQRYHDAL